MTESESDGRAGRYVTQLDGYRAFEPTPLPPTPPVRYDDELADRLSGANLALGRLDGLARVLPEAELFLAMYVRQEALLSSQIEGTDCTLDDVLAFTLEPGEPYRDLDVREVVNYVAALNRGVELLGELPLCNRLLRETHATLLRDGRGADKTPGEFRTTQNWIGPAGCTLGNATYVPPPKHVMLDAMSNLEAYLHDEQGPVLLTAGIAHAQFETIHPFLDGNGRTGRLLVSLLLQARGVLAVPVLYLSTFLKRHRDRYFARLMGVRINGDWESWLKFFLEGVEDAASGAADTAAAVHALREADRSRLTDAGGGANDLILLDQTYGQPLINSRWVTRTLHVTPTTANKLLERAEDVGVLRETTGFKRNRIYRYDAYLALFDDPGLGSAADETVS